MTCYPNNNPVNVINTMSQQEPTPLQQHFAPQTLTQLNVSGGSLIASVCYMSTPFDKTGMADFLSKIGRKLPKIKHLTPVKETVVQMDLDLSCVVLDDQKQALQTIWYGHLRNDNDSIIHQGDALQGATDFEHSLQHQEEICVHLSELPKNACELLFFVSSFHHHPLSLANKGSLRLSDNENATIHKCAVASLNKDTTAILAWHIIRQGDDFLIKAPLSPVPIKNTQPRAFQQTLMDFAQNMHKTNPT